MILKNENGSIVSLLISIVSSLLMVVFIVLFIWAFMSRNSYKNDVTGYVNNAVQQADATLTTKLEQQFAKQEQYPYTSYTTPSQYGNVKISYPKTWSAYVDNSGSVQPIEAYFNPNYVPGTDQTSGNNYALRLEISSNSYQTELANYTSNAQGQGSTVTIQPYKLAKVPSQTGVIITGQIRPNKSGTMFMIPLRTTTLKIWTDSNQYNNLLLNQILPLVTYNP